MSDRPVTILAVADQVSPILYDYFSPERWRHVDVVVSCGDLPPGYLDFLCSMLNVPVLYVRGNHDASFRAEEYDGCVNLHGRIVECAGLRFAGFEGSHRYSSGEYQHTQAQMRHTVGRLRVAALLAGRPDVIVSHAPPAGYHDARDRCHTGFSAFRTAMAAWEPQYLLHGHMHAYAGPQSPTRAGATVVMNAYPFVEVQIVPRRSAHTAGDRTSQVVPDNGGEVTGRAAGSRLGSGQPVPVQPARWPLTGGPGSGDRLDRS